MSHKVTEEATAAASVLSTVRENVSYQTFSQVDENCANTILPKQSLECESGKDESKETTANSSGTDGAANNNASFVLKTAGICLAHFSVVCLRVTLPLLSVSKIIYK
jgi:hypothetical protein